jgi:hypothetical protein
MKGGKFKMKEKVIKTKKFDCAHEAFQYLYGVDDGQVNVGEFDIIEIKFVKKVK